MRVIQGCYGWFSSTEFLGEWQSHETKLTDPKKSLSFLIYPPAYIKLIWWEASLNSETWNSYKECACSLLWYRRMLAISAFAVSCGKKIAFIVWEVGFPQHHAIAKERKFKLKFETGSYFLFFFNVYSWANKISRHSGFSLDANCNAVVCRFYIRKAEYHSLNT